MSRRLFVAAFCPVLFVLSLGACAPGSTQRGAVDTAPLANGRYRCLPRGLEASCLVRVAINEPAAYATIA